MVQMFRTRAGWFVAAGWLLLLVAIPICLAIGFASGIDAFCHPAHRLEPFDRVDAQAAGVGLAGGVLAATMSSIALGLKFHRTASISCHRILGRCPFWHP